MVPKFVVQFGLAADPAVTARWKKAIPDDPKNAEVGNTKGTVSFATAGKNTRTSQLFINLSDNDFLNNMGFTPIGRVSILLFSFFCVSVFSLPDYQRHGCC